MAKSLTIPELNPIRKYSLNELTEIVFDTLNIRRIIKIYGSYQPVSNPKDQFDPWREQILQPTPYTDKIYMLKLTTNLTDIDEILSSPEKPVFLGRIEGLDIVVNAINQNLIKPNAGIIKHNNPIYSSPNEQKQIHISYPLELLIV